ncbi:MAG: hydroxymethylbilane synthase [Alphaproteobacteria bacterium]|nr:hydroxymethylbilane synthase [Alphaproteobacteria bacterium]
MKFKTIRIGTRGSPLALAQAQEVKERLMAVHKIPKKNIELVVIKTMGDIITDRALIKLGGKGLFTKQIEDDLLDLKVDLAVHSMKDVMAVLPEGLVIPCMLPREDPRDVWISEHFSNFHDLPQGGCVGTSSLRRAAQLLQMRPDIRIKTFRGNVETRIEKMRQGEVDGTLLAFAGLNRLGKLDCIKSILDIEHMLPAAGQGALGIECREDNQEMLALIHPLNDPDTSDCVLAERAFLRAVDGSCGMPVAALGKVEGNLVKLTGLVASIDGKNIMKAHTQGLRQNADQWGFEFGKKIYESLSPQILEEMHI